MEHFRARGTDYIIRKILKDEQLSRNIIQPSVRISYAYLEAWASIMVNLLLAILKGVLGVMVNSIALITDAVHTAADFLSSIIILLGFKLSSLPASDKHPHGHGRVEFIAAFIISLMLIVAGAGFAFSSYERLFANTPVQGTYLVAAILLVTAVVKEILAQFSLELGQRIKSSALDADAWHHRTDAITNILVAIAIIASMFGYYWVDAVLGFGVSILIMYTGAKIFRETCSKIIGEVDMKEVSSIKKMALEVENVWDVHDVIVHDYGAYKNVSLHITVPRDSSLTTAHDIAVEVEEVLIRQRGYVVTVHVDAANTDSPPLGS